jgi:hypothetical protein
MSQEPTYPKPQEQPIPSASHVAVAGSIGAQQRKPAAIYNELVEEVNNAYGSFQGGERYQKDCQILAEDRYTDAEDSASVQASVAQMINTRLPGAGLSDMDIVIEQQGPASSGESPLFR